MTAAAPRLHAMKVLQIAVAVLALGAGGPSRSDEALDRSFSTSSIVIETGNSACYHFDVYLALTVEQQRRGLMQVRRLPTFSGMLFAYPTDDMHSMWMKNTLIPLDILFIRGDGSVASIARMTEPHSLRSIASDEPVKYVLELNGGVADELGIDSDSVVYLPEL